MCAKGNKNINERGERNGVCVFMYMCTVYESTARDKTVNDRDRQTD